MNEELDWGIYKATYHSHIRDIAGRTNRDQKGVSTTIVSKMWYARSSTYITEMKMDSKVHTDPSVIISINATIEGLRLTRECGTAKVSGNAKSRMTLSKMGPT